MKILLEVLYFSNKLTFTGYLEKEDYEKFNRAKNVITDEFYDVITEKLFKMICDVDSLHICL